MFKIYLLDSQNYPTKIYDDINVSSVAVTDPELELNGESGILIGKLTFKLLDSANIETLRLLENTIVVTQMINNVETVIFRGRPFLRDEDEYNDQDYTFEGILSALNDTEQCPSGEYLVGWPNHFETILNRHNTIVGNTNRRIDYSKINADDPSSYMYTLDNREGSLPDLIHRFTTEYTRVRASTMEHLKTQYVESFGGYFYIENEPYTLNSSGQVILHNYLKYIDIHNPDQAHVNSQKIEFGSNLISIKRSANAEDFATVLVPLGAQLTDIEKSWPYYQSAANWKITKITDSPDSAETIGYANPGAAIDAENGKLKTGLSTNYRVLYDVEVNPGDIFFLTTYLQGVSTDYSIAAYAVIPRSGTTDSSTLIKVGPSVKNSKDSNNNVEVKTLSLVDERIEIPTDINVPSGMKLRLARYATDADNASGFMLRKFNPKYKEENATIMSVNEQTSGTIRKIGKFNNGRDVYPDATDSETTPEAYEQSKRLFNYDLFQVFGPIEKTIEYSNYNQSSVNNLKAKASRELEHMGENIEIEVQAADLSYIDSAQESFNAYDLVPVKSEPNDIDMLLPIVKMTLPLSDPASATYTLQNDIYLSQENKKYISQMVASNGIGQRPTTTVYIGGGSDSGGGGGSGDTTTAVLYTFQSLSESQKAQARSNIGAVATVSGKGLSTNDYTTAEKNKLESIPSDIVNSVLYTQQSLTDSQKQQARFNIGAVALEDIPEELPETTELDNGKILGVKDGTWQMIDPDDLPDDDPPDPTGDLEHELMLCSPDPFTAQIYNGVVQDGWWDETDDGDIDHFYAYLSGATRLYPTLRPDVVNNGKILVVRSGEWVYEDLQTHLNSAIKVSSVNGKTGAVVLKTSDLQNDSGYVTANQAAAAAPVKSVNGKTGVVTVNELPDSTNANVGDAVVKTSNGVEWGSVFPPSTMYDAGKVLGKDVDGNNIWKYTTDSLIVAFDSLFADDSGMTLWVNYPGYDTAHAIATAAGTTMFGAYTFVDQNTNKVYFLSNYSANLSDPTQSYVVYQRYNKDSKSFEYATIRGNSNAFTSVTLSSEAISSSDVVHINILDDGSMVYDGDPIDSEDVAELAMSGKTVIGLYDYYANGSIIYPLYLTYADEQGIVEFTGFFFGANNTWMICNAGAQQGDVLDISYFPVTDYTVTVNLNSDGTIQSTSPSTIQYSEVKNLLTRKIPVCLLVNQDGTRSRIYSTEQMDTTTGPIVFAGPIRHANGNITEAVFLLDSSNNLTASYTARENALRKVTDLASYYASTEYYPSVKGVWDTFQRKPVTVWEVQDVSQGLLALNTNISSSLAWQLTDLDMTPYKRIKIYSRAGRKTGAIAQDSSITPASIIEMSLDDRAKETVSQNVFIGSSVVQNPNDANRLGLLTCAVSADKTKFAVVRSTTLYGTAATNNNDAYPRVFMIEGYYD